MLTLSLVMASGAKAQLQHTSGTVEGVEITSSTYVALGTVTLADTGTFDVALSAHLYVEGRDFAHLLYEFAICRETADGFRVGRTFWRPPATANSTLLTGGTVFVTGFDPAATGPVTYVLCARKFHEEAADVTVYVRGLNAERAPPAGRVVGMQDTSNSTGSVKITSTNRIAIATLTVGEAAAVPIDVTLVAHLYVEGRGFNHRIYDIGICRDTASGSRVGRTFWRPPAAAGATSFTGDAVGVTGFDGGVTGPATYVLCARKFHDDAPDVEVFLHGLNAIEAPASTTLWGTQDISNTADTTQISSTSRVAVGTLSVASGEPADLVLTAHLYLEGRAFTHLIYDIGICRDTASGLRVGRTFWRPAETASTTSFRGDALVLTGFDSAVSGSATYVLCVGKLHDEAPDITALLHGLSAHLLAESTVAPTATSTVTSTPSPTVTPPPSATSTAEPTASETAPPPPTATIPATPTDTPLPPTPSQTPAAPTHSPTSTPPTHSPPVPTDTPTPPAPSVTPEPTVTPAPPSPTDTTVAPTSTPTSAPPTATQAPPTSTQTSPPSTDTPVVSTTTPVPPCLGDCNGDGTVTIDELNRGVNIALGGIPLDQCPAFYRNGDGGVTIDELIAAVNNALNRCPA